MTGSRVRVTQAAPLPQKIQIPRTTKWGTFPTSKNVDDDFSIDFHVGPRLALAGILVQPSVGFRSETNSDGWPTRQSLAPSACHVWLNDVTGAAAKRRLRVWSANDVEGMNTGGAKLGRLLNHLFRN